MSIVKKFQNKTKIVYRLSTCLLILSITISMTISGVYALPPDKNFGGKCDNDVENLHINCCWTETVKEGIEIEYCQNCDIDTNTGDITNCGKKTATLEKNDCSTRPQITCRDLDSPQLKQELTPAQPSKDNFQSEITAN